MISEIESMRADLLSAGLQEDRASRVAMSFFDAGISFQSDAYTSFRAYTLMFEQMRCEMDALVSQAGEVATRIERAANATDNPNFAKMVSKTFEKTARTMVSDIEKAVPSIVKQIEETAQNVLLTHRQYAADEIFHTTKGVAGIIDFASKKFWQNSKLVAFSKLKREVFVASVAAGFAASTVVYFVSPALRTVDLSHESSERIFLAEQSISDAVILMAELKEKISELENRNGK